MKDFAGTVSFRGGTCFQNHKGIVGSRILSSEFVDLNKYEERGIKARVLTFQRYWFWSVDISGLKFIGNVAYHYIGKDVKT